MNFGYIKRQFFNKTIFVGELSLDGKINKAKGILPICIEALKYGIKRVIVPKENAKEAAIIRDLEIIGVSDLQTLIKYLKGEIIIDREIAEIENIFEKEIEYEIDFSEVKGQEIAKRALEIASAGGHNILMVGSPGSRKDNDGKKSKNNFTRFNI